MPQVDWYVQGIEYANCNCDYGFLAGSNRFRLMDTARGLGLCVSTKVTGAIAFKLKDSYGSSTSCATRAVV